MRKMLTLILIYHVPKWDTRIHMSYMPAFLKNPQAYFTGSTTEENFTNWSNK